MDRAIRGTCRARNDKSRFIFLLTFWRCRIATRGGQKAMKKKRVHVVIKSPHRAVSEEEIDAARVRGTPVVFKCPIGSRIRTGRVDDDSRWVIEWDAAG